MSMMKHRDQVEALLKKQIGNEAEVADILNTAGEVPAVLPPPPGLNLRVLCVPARLFVSCMRTTSQKRCDFTLAPKTESSRSIEPTFFFSVSNISSFTASS